MTTSQELKRQLRSNMKQRMKSSIDSNISIEAGCAVLEKLKLMLQQPLVENRKPAVSVFISKYPEISTMPLLDHLFKVQAQVFIPAWHDQEMWMCRVETRQDLNQIVASAPINCIPMPSENRVEIEDVMYDFIIMPGLIFDGNCHRLGYGFGHYDYFLSRYFIAHPSTVIQSPKLIGIGHDFQITEGSLPFEEHDIQLDIVCTPKHTINRNE